MVFATAAQHDQALARRQGAIEGRRLTRLSRLWPIEKKQKEIAGRFSAPLARERPQSARLRHSLAPAKDRYPLPSFDGQPDGRVQPSQSNARRAAFDNTERRWSGRERTL